MCEPPAGELEHMDISGGYLISIVEVAWINILLSGDNAVVIALACRSLPDRLRYWGIVLGSAVAILLRIAFALVVTQIMAIPYLQALAGLLLVWIAVSLGRGGHSAQNVRSHATLWRAVGTIALADATMSLDNVVAIAAIAAGNHWLFIIGLLLSIPLIVVGATLISSLVGRYPILVLAGAGLLGWIAGEMIGDDLALLGQLGLVHNAAVHFASAIIGTLLVLSAALLFKGADHRRA
jgi:YjbE family integral membrane protein